MLGTEILDVVFVADLDHHCLHRRLAADIAYQRDRFQLHSPFAGPIVHDVSAVPRHPSLGASGPAWPRSR
jgi:hypothetical protein